MAVNFSRNMGPGGTVQADYLPDLYVTYRRNDWNLPRQISSTTDKVRAVWGFNFDG